MNVSTLTPSKCSTVSQAKAIRRESPHYDDMEIKSFDEHPKEVGNKKVVEQRHHQLTQTLTTTELYRCVDFMDQLVTHMLQLNFMHNSCQQYFNHYFYF